MTDAVVLVGMKFTGDFNIHFIKAFDLLSRAFVALIDTFGFTQFVHEPTHCSGNTLDLILSGGIEALMFLPLATLAQQH